MELTFLGIGRPLCNFVGIRCWTDSVSSYPEWQYLFCHTILLRSTVQVIRGLSQQMVHCQAASCVRLTSKSTSQSWKWYLDLCTGGSKSDRYFMRASRLPKVERLKEKEFVQFAGVKRQSLLEGPCCVSRGQSSPADAVIHMLPRVQPLLLLHFTCRTSPTKDRWGYGAWTTNVVSHAACAPGVSQAHTQSVKWTRGEWYYMNTHWKQHFCAGGLRESI